VDAAGGKEGREDIINELSVVVRLNSLDRKAELCWTKAQKLMMRGATLDL
jgi:hypothetical protein